MFRFPGDMALYSLIKRRGKLLLVSLLVLGAINQSGVLVHLFEQDLNDNFSYPLDRPDFREILDQRINGREVDVKPINAYDYRMRIANADKCSRVTTHPNDSSADVSPFPRLVFIIKSSMPNLLHRDTIRKTWGFEERFSDVAIRRVFVLGSCDSQSGQELVDQSIKNRAGADRVSCQEIIDEENSKHNDIVQFEFIDSYFNNTIKTMVGLKWLVNMCPGAEFGFFVDDDYYVSTKNLLKLMRDPFREEAHTSMPAGLSDQLDFDGRLYAGYVFPASSPMRHKFSKWYVSLEEYPYSRYPVYVTAGAYLLSNRAFKELHLASSYVKHFRFDDIYMGILAKKIALTPTHSSQFYFYKKEYDVAAYSSVIASHGFADHQELTRVWNEQKSRGNC